MQLKGKWLIASALIILIVCAASYTVLQFQVNPNPPIERDVLFQLSAFNTFSEGNYAGYMAYGELAEHGDSGIGTFEGLDGEMIALDGVFYQIPADGRPVEANPSMSAPYATVTFFEADQTLTISDLNYTQLKTQLDAMLPSKNAIYAIKVTGSYTYAQTRSPQKQNQPYPPLTEALKDQSIFTLGNVSATAVGFWFPASMQGVDFAGYHLHLITNDYTAGGHLLECIIKDATVEIDHINEYNLVLP